jgi:hypothetical protein
MLIRHITACDVLAGESYT